MIKDVENFTDKEIMFNIMISLMQMEGHLRELVLRTAPIEYEDGGDDYDAKPNN